MASNTPSQNTRVSGKTHYARLGHAAQTFIPKLLRQLLSRSKSEVNVFTDCKKNRDLMKILNGEEYNIIKNAATDGYANFDVTLAYKVIRNLNLVLPPTRGWDFPTDPDRSLETTLGDDVERIRRMRNKIIHRGNTDVTDTEFSECFTTFKEIAKRFEKALQKNDNEFVAEFSELETCCMDEALEETYLNELQIYKEQIKVLEAAVDMLKTPIEERVNILPNPEEMVCLEGDSITLAEGAVSKEKVKVECYKDSDEQVGDIIVESKDTLYKVAIPKATVEHSGKYTIKIGDKTCETVVYVKERISSIELRAYQHELAEIASKGINTIICAGTNAGKTYVAFYVIENHLLRYPKGKVVFINKTNVLLEQQFRRARNSIESLMQHEVNKWEAETNPEDQFIDMVNNSRLLFITPKSLSNRLEENAKFKVSIEDFSLIIFDECHHAHGSNLYNEVMSYYRMLKFKKKPTHLPQILGLTASPGTNKANNVDSAVDHLKCLMANLDVKELSVVKQNEAELLEYSAKPDKVQITSRPRRIDPVKEIILDAISYVEKIFTSTKVLHFLASHVNETRGVFSVITKPQADKTGQSYVKWIADTKNEVENIMHIDRQIPRLLHACLRHLDLYSDCLEVNSLLEIEDVREILRDGYGKQSFESQTANTDEEGDIVSKLRDVFTAVCQVGTDIERNPDISEISKRVEQEFIKLREESRFLIFVKKRTTAKALAERLPDHLKCTYLTGSHVSAADGGLSMAKQIEVVDEFKNGRYLCIVATSIACEGLDIQQCNLMIRYKFHADEISSLQMRGRIRQKGGTEVLLASSKDLERESQNIERQYLMNEAIKKVISRDLSNEIERAERVTYDMEEAERRTAKIKISNKIWGDFSAVCKVCGIAITDCKYIRRINGTHIIIIDKDVLTIIKRVPIKKVRKFDGIQKLDKVYGRDCGHNWGSILKYSECDFVSLSQDYVSIFDKSTNKFVKSEKWSDLPFKIQDVIEEEIFQYNA